MKNNSLNGRPPTLSKNISGVSPGRFPGSLPIRRECIICGQIFTAKTVKARFCSEKCKSHFYYAKKKLKNKKKDKESFSPLPRRTATGHSRQRNEGEYLSVQQAAELLQVCRQTIYNLEARGQLFILHLSSRLSLIRRRDIEALFERGVPLTPIVKVKPKANYKDTAEIPLRSSPKKPDQWATNAELCKMFGLNPKSVYNFSYNHSVPRRKSGGATFYSVKHFSEHFDKKSDHSRQSPFTSQVSEIPKPLPKVKLNGKFPKSKEGYLSLRTAAQKYKFTTSAVKAHLARFHIPVIIINGTPHFLEKDYKTALKGLYKKV